MQGNEAAMLTACAAYALQACAAEVLAFIDPLEELTRAEVRRIEAADVERSALTDRLLQLKRQAASVE
jgi:hypothetical protein